MSKSVLLWISEADDRDDPELRPFLTGTEREADLHFLSPGEITEFIDRQNNGRIIGAIIAPSVRSRAALARQILQLVPGSEVIFILSPESDGSRKQETNLAFLYGHHRTVDASDADQAIKTVRRLIDQARRQRRSRWALARMNEEIAQVRDQKAHQRRLAISDRLLVSILEQSPDALFALDLDGYVIAKNRAAVRHFDLGEAEGTHFEKTPLARRLPEVKALVGQAIESRQVRRREIELAETPDEPGRFLEASASPVVVEDDHLVGITICLRDVSPLKIAERELRKLNTRLEEQVAARTQELTETNRQLEGLLYSVAHDLRAPVRSIAGFSQILREDFGDDLTEGTTDLLSRINRAALRMDLLIRDLLNYSRATKIALPLRPVKLDTALETARTVLADQIAEADGEVAVELTSATVVAHQTTLEQAVINLISNALKYPRPGEPIHIRVFAEKVDDRCRLWVVDNGIGIDPAYQQKIFGIFERIEVDTDPSGTGIGLAIVKGGVERMGGTVGVESAPGKGSSFWIELPIAGD